MPNDLSRLTSAIAGIELTDTKFESLSRLVYNTDLSTPDFLAALEFAKRMVEDAVQRHSDISSEYGSYSLVDAVKEVGSQVGEFGWQVAGQELVEGEVRDGCRRWIMACAQLRQKIDRAGADVRRRVAREREEAARRETWHGRGSRGKETREMLGHLEPRKGG